MSTAGRTAGQGGALSIDRDVARTTAIGSRLLDAGLRLLPAKTRILEIAARLPPGFRSSYSLRLFAALSRRTIPGRPTLAGNLGISRRLTCEIPVDQVFALYGKPALYRGERASLELAARLSRDCDAFVDIGAHLGYFTFFVDAQVSGELPLFFFEPDAELHARLEQNVRANRLGRVQGYHRAVGAVDGTATFYVNRTDPLSGSLTREFAVHHDVVATPVEVERFCTVANRLGFSNACVKVDVENAEADFLEGAAGALDRVSYLIIEVLRAAHERRFVQALMAEGGFRAYYIDDYTLRPSLDGSFEYRPPEYNWLFCRDEPATLLRKAGVPFQIGAGR